MKKVITLSLLILPLIQAAAQLPDANQIMTRSRELTLTGSMSATLRLTITEKNGSVRNRTISMIARSFPDGSEKRIIRFLEPADVKGTGILIYDNRDSQDEMWIYLPALKKTRRIVSSEKGKGFMNSEFSNSDMTSPTLSDFNHKHTSGSGENNQWIIESTPVSAEKEDEYGYSKKISFLNTETSQIKKMEFYNFNNQLFKTIEIKEVQLLGEGKYIIKDMKASNLSNGRSSEIQMDKITTNVTVENSVFTVQNLER
jgi:hypothetical protein